MRAGAPGSARKADRNPAGSVGGTFTVSELAAVLKGVLDEAFPIGAWVAGRISGISRSAGGAVFFDLIDPGPHPGQPEAKLPVVLLNRDRDRANAMIKRHGNAIRMTDGVQVRIQGMLDYHPPSGRLQLRMTAIDPAHTLGLMVVEREVLMRTLAGEGLLRANAARRMVPLPLRVGLVTSLGSAAHADVMKRLEGSRFAFTVTEVHATVQGRQAPDALAAAIAAAAGHADVVVVARGGGSRTDLAAFDHEAVTRAIAACPVPVLTGVGHETDRSVADEVAHTAHPTPTAAAGALVERVEGWLATLDRTARAIASRSRTTLQAADHAIDARDAAAAGAGRDVIAAADHRIRTVTRAIAGTGRDVLDRAQERLDSVAAQVEALDPIWTLRRGWSITRKADGRVVRSRADVAAGEMIITQVGDGTLSSTIRDSGETE